MRKTRLAIVMALLGSSFALTSAVAAPTAPSCTGAPCDAFCAAYPKLPVVVREDVFHSDTCPLR